MSAAAPAEVPHQTAEQVLALQQVHYYRYRACSDILLQTTSVLITRPQLMVPIRMPSQQCTPGWAREEHGCGGKHISADSAIRADA